MSGFLTLRHAKKWWSVEQNLADTCFPRRVMLKSTFSIIVEIQAPVMDGMPYKQPMHTSKLCAGCLLGAAAPGRRGVSAEQIGSQAAQELLEDLKHGGCVDRW